jgi:hypothetical protein
MDITGLDRKQLTNWFTNARKRIWQPKYGKLPKQTMLMKTQNQTPNQIASKVHLIDFAIVLNTNSSLSFPQPVEQIKVAAPTPFFSNSAPSPRGTVDIWQHMNDPWLPPLSPLLSHYDDDDEYEPEWNERLTFKGIPWNGMQTCH